MSDIQDSYTLMQIVMDLQEEFIAIIKDDEPIILNRSFLEFFGVKSFEAYQKEFGAFVNHFVPHPSYFHAEKVAQGESWVDALEAIEEEKRIVTMLNRAHEPRAFKVSINSSHPNYAVITLKDISADLIKCIMIENNVSIDKASGAYNKEYFLHTAETFYEGALYNKQLIGLSMITLGDSQSVNEKVSSTKKIIRQNDMLIKYNRNILLLAYLSDNPENILAFNKKIFAHFGTSLPMRYHILQEKEKIPHALKVLEESFESDASFKQV